MIIKKINTIKLIAIVLMSAFLSACQTMKLTAVDKRDDLRLTELVSSDG